MSRLPKLFGHVQLNDVFIPGGQPSITYVDRKHLGLEQTLKKAIALPNTIVSLTGPTKSGKTVLCTSVLGDREYVWIDGGQIKNDLDVWTKATSELRLASETLTSETTTFQHAASATAEGTLGVPGASVKVGITPSGSKIRAASFSEKYVSDTMMSAIDKLLEANICLVIDDFHYIDEPSRASLVRSLKGPVYRGLKVILLSTPHRAFDAIRAESEITGRFRHVTVPTWSADDLILIAQSGFHALNVGVSENTIRGLAIESDGSPLLMQRFCWNLCFDSGVEETSTFEKVLHDIDVESIYDEVAEDAGLPIYEKLASGPQTRTERIPRPLVGGGTADIYQAILLAIARTGPKERLSYDQIRTSLNEVLSDKVPQKIEVSNALNHLTSIDEKENKDHRAIDWDAKNLNLFVTDPFFRFYLRWVLAKQASLG